MAVRDDQAEGHQEQSEGAKEEESLGDATVDCDSTAALAPSSLSTSPPPSAPMSAPGPSAMVERALAEMPPKCPADPRL